MIKRPIDENCFKETIESLEDAKDWIYVNELKSKI